MSGEGVDVGRALTYLIPTGKHILVVPSSSYSYLIRVVMERAGAVRTVFLATEDQSAIVNGSEGWTADKVQPGDATKYEVGPAVGFASLQEALEHGVVLEAACAACEDLEEAAEEAHEDWVLAAAIALAARAIDAEDDYNDSLDWLAECLTASNG